MGPVGSGQEERLIAFRIVGADNVERQIRSLTDALKQLTLQTNAARTAWGRGFGTSVGAANQRMANAQAAHNQRMANAQAAHNQRMLQAQQRHAKQMAKAALGTPQTLGSGFLLGLGGVGGPWGRILRMTSRVSGLTGAAAAGGWIGVAAAAGMEAMQARGRAGMWALQILAREAQFLTRVMTGVTVATLAAGAAFTKAAVANAAKRDQEMRALTAIMGGSARAKQHMKELIEIQKAPGLALPEAIVFSQQMQAQGMPVEMVNDYLRSLANLNALSEGTPEQIERVGFQLSQLLGRGKLSGEQIRAISRDMPMFMRVIKTAFGTTSADEINRMGLTAEQVFKRILWYMDPNNGAIPYATWGIGNAMVNLRTAWWELLRSFGEPLIREQTYKSIEAISNIIWNLQPAAQALGETIMSFLPDLSRMLEEMGTEQGMQKVFEYLKAAAVDVEYRIDKVSYALAPIVRGGTDLLATIIPMIGPFNKALLTLLGVILSIAQGLLSVASAGLRVNSALALARGDIAGFRLSERLRRDIPEAQKVLRVGQEGIGLAKDAIDKVLPQEATERWADSLRAWGERKAGDLGWSRYGDDRWSERFGKNLDAARQKARDEAKAGRVGYAPAGEDFFREMKVGGRRGSRGGGPRQTEGELERDAMKKSADRDGGRGGRGWSHADALTAMIVGGLGTSGESILMQARMMSQSDRITQSINGAAGDVGEVVVRAMNQFAAKVERRINSRTNRTTRAAAHA